MHRQLLGISQCRLADALGITFQQVQKYEKGVNRVSASRLQAIAAFFEVPVSSFFEIKGDTEGHQTPLERGFLQVLSSPEALAFHAAFTKISDSEVRRRVADLVKALAEPSREAAEARAGQVAKQKQRERL